MDIVLKKFKMARIDYDKLANVMAEDRDLLRTYYYHCLPHQSTDPSQEEKDKFSNAQRFFRRLNHLDSFTVREGKLAFRGMNDEGVPIYEQKRVDVMLATDIVMHSTKRLITHASIITGDSDFLPAIEIAQSEGVQISLYYYDELRPHDELLDKVDVRRKIDEKLINSIKRD
ncbi:hypothetical protein J22TS1_43610 [Siminovitchia terrae]|nr:hypothetical protein J22TS1_43610 [Siminovitchia terrae]